MTTPITMIELFGGIGAQERALRQLDIPYKVTHYCDCDANATLSYVAMRWDLEKEMETFNFPSQEQMIEELQTKNLGYDFQKDKHTITKRTSLTKLKQYYLADKLSKNLGDISKVERLPYADFWTYSFPCTDLSVAGKGEGMVNKCDACGYSWPIDFSNADEALICPECGATVSSSTRSGLLGQVQRLLSVAKTEDTLPKYLLLENVKNLTGKKFIGQFEAWIKWLDSIGFNTYWKVVNSKHMGIPQNRERVFAISIRKDVDTKGFTFPEQIPLTTRLRDVLEKNVDEKYYLPDDRIEKILNSTFMQEKKRIQMSDVCDTLLARDWKDPKCVPVENKPEVKQLMNIMPTKTRDNPNQGRVYDTDGIAPTLTKMDGGNREPMIVDEIKIIGNYMPSNHDASRVVDIDGIAPTVKENHGTVTAIAEPQLSLEPNTCLIQPKDRDYKKKGQSREVHIENKNDGVSHALRTNGETMVMEPQVVKVGQASSDGSQSGMVYSPDGIFPTLCAGCHGYAMGNILEEQEPFIVASRGRNPDNPSDRTVGAPTEQRLEPNFSGCTNTLTSVQKDNYVCEPIVCEERKDEGIRLFKDDCVGTLRTIDACGDKRVIEPEINPELVGGIGEKNFGKQYRQGNRVYNSETVAMALNAQPVGNTGGYSYLYAVADKIKWRIRKLTPKCCWRLMNFTDKDYDRAARYVSASALYKQAGNSIVVSCLIALMSSLFIEDGYKAEVWTKYMLNFND